VLTNLDPGTDGITDSKSAQKSGMNWIHVPNDPCLRWHVNRATARAISRSNDNDTIITTPIVPLQPYQQSQHHPWSNWPTGLSNPQMLLFNAAISITDQKNSLWPDFDRFGPGHYFINFELGLLDSNWPWNSTSRLCVLLQFIIVHVNLAWLGAFFPFHSIASWPMYTKFDSRTTEICVSILALF
jgi:hypothetical protein